MKVACAAIFALSAFALTAQTNNVWTNSTGGNWDDAVSWSLNAPPNSSQSVYLTNAGNATVEIDPGTAGNDPGSLSVLALTISGSNALVLTNAGTNAPLTILGTNALGAGFYMDGGFLRNSGSGMIIDDGLALGGDAAWAQNGGFLVVSNTAYFIWSTVDLTNVVFEGDVVQLISANLFNQHGGNASMQELDVLGGDYYLDKGGLSTGSTLISDQEGAAMFVQEGGTNQMVNLAVASYFQNSPVFYTNDGGALFASNIVVGGTGSGIVQNGGLAVVTNTLTIGGGGDHFTATPGFYSVAGGELFAGTLVVGNASEGTEGSFSENDSTVVISNSIEAGNEGLNTLTLSSGTLSCQNLIAAGGGMDIVQSGGALNVANLLQFSGHYAGGYAGLGQRASIYHFTGGTLNASNIQLDAEWIIGGGQSGGVTNPGYFQMGGLLVMSNAEAQLGQFLLADATATNAVIDFAGASAQLSFADSSGEAWTNAAILTITNWNGSLNGGGNDQLKFGTNANGLVSSQLGQIEFINPIGLSPDFYSAEILSTGEIVPNAASGTMTGTFTNSWTNTSGGYWQDASWSLGFLPNSRQTVEITNAGEKTVTINAQTAASHPGSLTMTNLAISAGNTLLLDNVGTNTPLRLLNGFAVDGALTNLNSGIIVESGVFAGTYPAFSEQIYQDGGFVQSQAPVGISGNYQLMNGLFQAGEVEITPGGTFDQYGGTAMMGPVSFIAGFYGLYGGHVTASSWNLGALGAGANGGFDQEGGTNQAGSIVLGVGGGFYTLDGGLLCSGSVSLYAFEIEPIFQQNGGVHCITNTLQIQGSSGHNAEAAAYELANGKLFAGNIAMDDTEGYSFFSQSAGTSVISGAVEFLGPAVAPGTIGLGSGIFACANVFNSNGCVTFDQGGGAVTVSNLLQFGGYCPGGRGTDYIIPQGFSQYYFSGGTLTAGNIEMDGIFNIGSSTQAGRITNGGYFQLSGLLNIGEANENLGAFILSYPTNVLYDETGAATTNLALTHAAINFTGSNGILRFANSSGEIWSNTATLIVANWNGSLNGGGNDQLFFGAGASGLTASQLAQVQFVNPAGLPAGNYSARLLENGELVPKSSWLAFGVRNGLLELNWSPGQFLQFSTNVFGPYVDLSNAVPPYVESPTNASQGFFRLRE